MSRAFALALSTPSISLEERIAFYESGPDDFEHNLATRTMAFEQYFHDSEVFSFALESMRDYQEVLRQAIAKGPVDSQTLALVRMGVRQQFSQISDQGIPALESASLAGGEAQAALESFQSVLDLLAQDFVVGHKQSWAVLMEFFNDTERNLERYEAKVASAKREFESKEHRLSSTVQVDMHRLWYFFSTGEKAVTNFTAEVSKDLAISKYILTTYPRLVSDQLKKLTSALKQARNPRGFQAALLEINKMPNAAELFDRKYINNDHLLGVYSLSYDVGSARDAAVLGGKTLQGLANAASSKTVKEDRNGLMTAGKTITHHAGYGQIASMILSPKVDFTLKELGKAFEYAESYLANARAYLKGAASIREAMTEFEAVFSEIKGDDGDDHNTSKALGQISQYANNLMHAYTSPAKAEISRAIQAGKYCMWLGLRGIYNAS